MEGKPVRSESIGSPDAPEAGTPEDSGATLFALPEQAPSVPFAVSLLGLGSIRGLGRKGLSALVDATGGRLGALWATDPGRLAAALHKAKTPGADRVLIEILDNRDSLLSRGAEEREVLAKRGVSVLAHGELPFGIATIPDAPRWLFVEGDIAALWRRPAVAVVGTRQASDRGLHAARIVARHLSAYPITLVSGLAEGIDAEAHRESLMAEVTNVAFLGHGVNVVFPASTADIRRRIVEKGGAVVTEYLPGEHYKKSNFVERNRLQAAAADLVVPVEGNIKGGTTHTIRFARKYSRPVLGLRWGGANGLLEHLSAERDVIIDIHTDRGKRALDSVFRTLADRSGHDTYALSVAQRWVEHELATRDVQTSDLKRLLDRVVQMLRDRTHQGEEGDPDA